MDKLTNEEIYMNDMAEYNSKVNSVNDQDNFMCDYCTANVPAMGYWVCPVCDAEWTE